MVLDLTRKGTLAAHAREWALAVKNLVFPIFCKMCGTRLLTDENAGHFCATCWELSPRVNRPFCTVCGRPHPGAVGLATRSNFPCARCREAPLPHVRRMAAPALYKDAIREAVLLLKFGGRKALAEPLAEMMLAFLDAELAPEPRELVVPVPLYPVRERERGYNQAALLARAIAAQHSEWTFATPVRRIRPTQAQTRLKGTARRENVRGAFQAHSAGVSGRRVLLVDDVVTTGSTVNECAGALLHAGALSVDVLAVAFAWS
jgi:ComF family protein